MIKKLKCAVLNLGLMMQRSKVGCAIEEEANPIVRRKRQHQEHHGEAMFGLKQAEQFLEAYKSGKFEESIDNWRKEVEADDETRERQMPKYGKYNMSDRELAQVKFQEDDTGPMAEVHKELAAELAKQGPVSPPMDPEVYEETSKWYKEAVSKSDHHDHDGIPCGTGCIGHVTEPCKECGRQWPCAKLLDNVDPIMAIEYMAAINEHEFLKGHKDRAESLQHELEWNQRHLKRTERKKRKIEDDLSKVNNDTEYKVAAYKADTLESLEERSQELEERIAKYKAELSEIRAMVTFEGANSDPEEVKRDLDSQRTNTSNTCSDQEE